MGIQKIEDWYTVTSDDVIDSGGATLINQYYGGSLIKSLSSIFPGTKDQRILRFDQN